MLQVGGNIIHNVCFNFELDGIFSKVCTHTSMCTHLFTSDRRDIIIIYYNFHKMCSEIMKTIHTHTTRIELE